MSIAWRLPTGEPGVTKTFPRLEDGTPFPTLYYLTAPDLVMACSALEAQGYMATLTETLEQDAELAAAYHRAHESYLGEREALAQVPEIEGISAGGMPTRVKCLHALVAHSLAAGPGVNPIGDAALAEMGYPWTENQ